jgi:hypothetical protein
MLFWGKTNRLSAVEFHQLFFQTATSFMKPFDLSLLVAFPPSSAIGSHFPRGHRRATPSHKRALATVLRSCQTFRDALWKRPPPEPLYWGAS